MLKFNSIPRKTFSLFLALTILAIPLLAQVDQTNLSQARMQAEIDAKRNANAAVYFIAGCAGSLLGLLIAQVVTPSPPQAILIGKSPEYIAAYTDVYVKKIKSIRTKYSLYGCGASVVVYGALILILAASVEEDLYYY